MVEGSRGYETAASLTAVIRTFDVGGGKDRVRWLHEERRPPFRDRSLKPHECNF